MRQIKINSADKSVDVYVIDATDGTPELGLLHSSSALAMTYRREGSAVVTPTMAALAALTTAHTDGGWEEIGAGHYRYDPPDAAWASGAVSVSIQGTATGMIVLPQTVQLVAFDPDDAIRMGMTALPGFAADAAGGLVVSDLGGLDIDAMNTAAVRLTATRAQVLDDWINGNRLDLILDTTAAAVVDTAIRTALGLAAANMDTQLGAAVTATGFSTIDPLTAIETRSALGLATANMDTQLGAAVTATGFSTIDPLTAIETRSALGLATANMDTQLGAAVTATGFSTHSAGSVASLLQDLSFADVWTTQLTESYAADGVAPTPAQALFLIQQALTDFVISGTALTVREIDGSTTAATCTLSDASNPVSITRAT